MRPPCPHRMSLMLNPHPPTLGETVFFFLMIFFPLNLNDTIKKDFFLPTMPDTMIHSERDNTEIIFCCLSQGYSRFNSQRIPKKRHLKFIGCVTVEFGDGKQVKDPLAGVLEPFKNVNPHWQPPVP